MTPHPTTAITPTPTTRTAVTVSHTGQSPPPVDPPPDSGGPGVAALLLLAVLAAAGYLLVCRIWPFANCRHCDGNGKVRSPSGRAWRPCKRCKGTGARIRIGTRLLTYLRRSHLRGTRTTRLPGADR